MKVNTAELLTAAKSAAVISSDHAIQSFTKVWMLDGKVSAFNGQVGVIVPVEDLPVVGGVDGKMLAKLLHNSNDDEVSIDVTEEGQLKFKSGRSQVKFNIMDPTHYIDVEPNQKKPKLLLEVPVAAFEDMQFDAMIGIKEAKGEALGEFLSLSLHYRNEGSVIAYSSDRHTLNRSIWKVDSEEPFQPMYIPLDFFKLFKRLRSEFEEGILKVTDSYAMIVADEDDDNSARLFCKLLSPTTPADFSAVIARQWPNNVYDKKLLVDIPDELIEAVEKASVIADPDAIIKIKAGGQQISLSLKSKIGGFSDTIELDKTHPTIETGINIGYLRRALPHVDRMYIGHSSLILLGPLRYSTYIACRS